MNKSDSIEALAFAMAQAQGEIENASKNSNNPHFKSKYADLAEVLNTVRPVFAKHGLSIAQWPGFNDGMATLETILMHKSGEWISSIAMTPLSKQDAQGVGSALTYLRRYSLAAIAGIAQEDDDGNAATKRDDPIKPRSVVPVEQKKELTPDMTKAWDNAKAAYKRDGNLIKVLSVMDMSQENQERLMSECENVA